VSTGGAESCGRRCKKVAAQRPYSTSDRQHSDWVAVHLQIAPMARWLLYHAWGNDKREPPATANLGAMRIAGEADWRAPCVIFSGFKNKT
jgi:hypothetical protein